MPDRPEACLPVLLQKPYGCQIVSPPTIVRTAHPFSFQPSNGVLRESDSLVLAVHSISGSISVMSAFAPIDNVPAPVFSNFAGSSVNISVRRLIELAFRLCHRL